MRFLKFAVIAALLLMPTVQVRASVLGSVLTPDGNPDSLIDDSRAFHVDVGGDGLNAGDAIFGFLRITSTSTATPVNPPTIVGIFSARIASGTGDIFGADPFVLAPLSDDLAVGAFTGLDLRSLAPTLTGSATATESEFDSSIFVVGSVPFAFDPIGLDGAGTGQAKAEDEISTIDTTLSYDALAGLGSTDDFFTAGFFGTGLSEFGGFTVFDTTLTPGGMLLPVPGASFSGPTGTVHDLVLDGLVRENGDDDPYQFQDNATLTLNYVPEPGALVVWGLLASLAGTVAARRGRH